MSRANVAGKRNAEIEISGKKKRRHRASCPFAMLLEGRWSKKKCMNVVPKIDGSMQGYRYGVRLIDYLLDEMFGVPSAENNHF